MTTKILRYACLLLIFLTPFIPLYVANSLFFPFITGKAFAFRIIVEILCALWLLLLLRDKKYAPRFSWLSVVATVFMISVFISDILGLAPLRSLWSNFERMEGWVVIVHLWAYFVITSSIFGAGSEGKRMWQYFFSTSLFAALIVGIYGVFQLAGWAAIHQGSSRIDSSLGNAAYMAVYMLFHSFLALYMSFVEIGRKKIGFSWVYLILGLFFMYLLFETATRGTILGLIGGIILALGIYAVFGKGQPKKSRGVAAGILGVIILLGVAFYFNRDAGIIQNHETLRRLASISWSDTKTHARGYIWPMAVKGTFESTKTALIGNGQENFNYIFNKHYEPKMWSHEQWFDRAHNVFLDWLVAGGLIGLILYAALFVFLLVYIWKADKLSFAEKCILTGLVAGYAVHNIFVFDNLISYIMFFTMLAFAQSLSAGRPIRLLERADVQSENKIIVRDYIFMPVIVLLLLATLYFVNVRPIQANMRLIDALRSCSSGGTPTAAIYARALSLHQTMADQEIREHLLSCAAAVFRNNYPDSVKADFYTLAKREIADQIARTPNDARIYVIGGVFFNNIGDWASGRPLLEKAHELSPRKQSATFELATNYMNFGKEKEAVALLEKAYLDAPENTTAAIAYAVSLLLTGQNQKAQDLFKIHPDIVYDTRILSVYSRLKQYDKVIAGYKALIAKDPTNIQLNATLVVAYLESGRTDLALAELEAMKLRFPQAKAQLDQALQEVRAGKR